MSQSNVEICQAAYEAFGRGDIENAFKDLDESCTWRSGSDLVPAGGVFHGKAEVVGGWLPEFGASYSDFRMSTDEFVGAEDRVIVLGTSRSTVAGQEIKSPFCHVWTYRDGKAIDAAFFNHEAIVYKALQGQRSSV